MVDVSGLRYAGSVSVPILWLAARTLKDRDGGMVLVRPRPAVLKVLTSRTAEQMFTIRPGTHTEPEPCSGAQDDAGEGSTRRPGVLCQAGPCRDAWTQRILGPVARCLATVSLNQGKPEPLR